MFKPITDIRTICLSAEAPLEEAIACIDRNQRGIALVVDASMKLSASELDSLSRKLLAAN